MPIFIGDVHGKYSAYKRIIREHQNTIQVGDMGVGFRRLINYEGDYKALPNPPHAEMVKANARFIRGNHDNPAECKKHSQWIRDGQVENDMMFLGGAYSIDKEWRNEGEDWWADEELSDDEFTAIMGVYCVAKPACMVTHDCPRSLYAMLHTHHFNDPSRTSPALEAMFEIHRPKVWVFGHHHVSFDQIVDGTRFICLAELEVKEINWLITK